MMHKRLIMSDKSSAKCYLVMRSMQGLRVPSHRNASAAFCQVDLISFALIHEILLTL